LLANLFEPGTWVDVARKTKIISHGVELEYPFQANLHGLPPDVIKECLLGFIEAWQAQASGAAAAPAANFEDFCLRKFGAGISRHFMIPYNQKLWGVHPREITAEWCSRFVPVPRLEDVVGGAVGAVPPELGYNVGFLYPRQGGIETMTRALAARIGEHGKVALGVSPDVIDPLAKIVEVGGEKIAYQAMVATIPLPELLKRIRGLPAEVELAATRLRCTTLRYFNLATRGPVRSDWHWIYVPEDKYPFYRVGVYSNALPSMAPAGMGSLYVELSDRGPRPSGVALDELRREVAQGLTAAGALARPEDVAFADLMELEYAYVVFDEHYYQATATIRAWLEAHDILPRGRYGYWYYNSMEDSIMQGRDAVALIESRRTPSSSESRP
jgi:protoporphyrinogen oxidase